MVKEHVRQIDISALPDLVRLAEEVQRTGTRALLTRDHEVLAELAPAPAPVRLAASRRTPRRAATRKPDDSLLRLIGIASGPDDGVHDVAENHDRYLADAYADPHE